MVRIFHSLELATVLLLLQAGQESNQVPASQSEKFWEEIANVKIMMASIADDLEKFNTLYLTKLETRLMSAASLLGHIDSNVKNLQERAHVWDTFQLHVAAWNEQISTLDRKVDILSRGHEKIALMDGKVSALVALDYKVERLVRKMDDADNKLTVIAKTLDNQRDDPLFGEFATRGILSTLKVIERKVDHIDAGVGQSKASRVGSKASASASEDRSELEGGDETPVGRGRLVIKCNTPVAVEELLRDVASKVDVIFDKLGQEHGEEEDEVEARTEGFMADDLVELPSKDSAETKLLDKLWKRLTSPAKKTSRAIEAMEKSVRVVENTTSSLRVEHSALLNEVLECCQKSSKDVNTFSARVLSALHAVEVAVNAKRGDDAVAKQFDRQRTDIERLFRQSRQCGNETKSAKLKEGEVEINVSSGQENATTIAQPRVTDSNGTSGKEGDARPSGQPRLPAWIAEACEDFADTESVSGEYTFGDPDVNAGGRDFSRRFCEMGVDGGGWTLIQRRGDFAGARQNFSRSWDEYKHGFGDLKREFWFGNDFIHRLTTEKEVTLRVELEDFDGAQVWAQYANFSVNGEAELYRMHVGVYRGNATDSLSAHSGVPFSTVDRVHDAAPPCCPCAPAYGGGWWFDSCFESNLNGAYFLPADEREHFRGIIWEHWLGNSSLRATRMMIRPRDRSRGGVPTTDTPDDTTNASTELPEDP